MVSAGELLRKQAKSDALIRCYLSSGQIVPSEISAAAILDFLSEGGDTVMDGFPRSLENAQFWTKTGAPLPQALALEASEDVIWQRLTKRGREDDSFDIIQERLRYHQQEWPRLMDYFGEYGTVTKVNADGHADVVWRHVMDLLHNGECPWLLPKNKCHNDMHTEQGKHVG